MSTAEKRWVGSYGNMKNYSTCLDSFDTGLIKKLKSILTQRVS